MMMTALPANWNSIAALALDRMLYSLAEGTVLAVLVSLVLRLVPQKNSRTRFAVWFSALVAVAMLPLLGAARLRTITAGFGSAGGPVGANRALFTIPATWAEFILAVWVALALLGLLRVAAGLWQVRRIRRSCITLNPDLLGPDLNAAIAEAKRSRPVSILVSPSASVPSAIGFFRPAVVVPAWLVEEDAAGELQHVLLHELAHLRRWDDWTNLAQKVVKAVLFFHPGVLWIEHKLSLDREMACDEEVLTRVSSPRLYAQSLARVAERSFLRRQMALAQAAVDRMKHLSQRITRILSLSEDRERLRATTLWKPAVAMVAVAGALCAAWTAQAPRLVSLVDSPAKIAASTGGSPSPVVATDSVTREDGHRQAGRVAATLAALDAKANPAVTVPAVYSPRRVDRQTSLAFSRERKRASQVPQRPELIPAQYAHSETVAYGAGEVLLTVVETQVVTGDQGASAAVWLVSVVQVRWIVPANHPKKEIPRKT